MSVGPRLAVAFIVLFGFFARAATFKSPLLDHHAWRQADTASIARNFVEERFNPLYPQVDWRGAQPNGYVATGFELSAVVVAAIARVTGFHPEIGRLVSALAFIASALLVWTFVRRRYGDVAGIGATFLYAFGYPLALFMERAFMNEALLIALSVAALVTTQRYLEFRRIGWWALTVALCVLIGITKPTYLVIVAPIAGLFIEARGRQMLRSPALAVLALLTIGAVALWYRHMHALSLTTNLSFGLFNKIFDADLVFSGSFWLRIARRLFRDVLGPVGIVTVVAGGWLAWKRRGWCELLGVAGFLAYLVAVPGGNLAHDYYQLVLMPIAPVLAGLAIGHWHARLTASRGPARAAAVVSVVLMVAAFSTFIRLSSFHSWFYYDPPDITFCETAAALGTAADRVIVMLDVGDPKYLFCMNRKGWLFDRLESTVHRVGTAWREGARYAYAHPTTTPPDVLAYLEEIGTRLPIAGPLHAYQLR
jgi:hypothetical protein